MRGWLVLSGAVLLAGCGGNGEDFTVTVAMSPSAAQKELALLDGGDLIRMSTIQALHPTTDGEQLVYVLHGDGESGELTMQFEKVGPNQTRIHVAVSVPERPFKSEGQQMVVSEDKIENALKANLRDWAKGVKEHGYASLSPINETLGSVMLLLNIDSDNEQEVAALISPEFLGGADGADQPQYEAAAGDEVEPMMDSDVGTAAAGRPMDDASGDEAEGYDPNAAETESLAYDSGY